MAKNKLEIERQSIFNSTLNMKKLRKDAPNLMEWIAESVGTEHSVLDEIMSVYDLDWKYDAVEFKERVEKLWPEMCAVYPDAESFIKNHQMLMCSVRGKDIGYSSDDMSLLGNKMGFESDGSGNNFTFIGNNYVNINNGSVTKSKHNVRPYKIDEEDEYPSMVAEDESDILYGLKESDFRDESGFGSYNYGNYDFGSATKKSKVINGWNSVKRNDRRPHRGEKVLVCGYVYAGKIEYCCGIYVGGDEFETEFDKMMCPEFVCLYWKPIDKLPDFVCEEM